MFLKKHILFDLSQSAKISDANVNVLPEYSMTASHLTVMIIEEAKMFIIIMLANECLNKLSGKDLIYM